MTGAETPLSQILESRTPGDRRALVAVDVLLVSVAVGIAFLLRFDGTIPARFLAGIPAAIALMVVPTILALWLYEVYDIDWGYGGFPDLARVAVGVLAATLIMGIGAQILHSARLDYRFPRSVVFIQLPITLVLLVGLRASPRTIRNLKQRRREDAHVPTLLVGADEDGHRVLDAIREGSLLPDAHVVGFVDDRAREGVTVGGVRVLGSSKDLRDLIERHGVRRILLSDPSLEPEDRQRIVEHAHQAGIQDVRTLPAPTEAGANGARTSQRPVRLEDLIGRQEIEIGTDDIQALLEGKRVLITGAGGTIGSELARQAARFRPHTIGLLDQDESRLYDLGRELEDAHGSESPTIQQHLVDIRDADAVDEAVRNLEPDLVIHAAAYKHVPMLEEHPCEALAVNVLGTHHVLQAARATGADNFVLVSTDKAVEPAGVMGATNRWAEAIVLDADDPDGTRTRAVRFGNVIGSRGSVVPIFQRQLAQGGPLTVTHPDAERYFMMTSEAVALVLKTAAAGEPGTLSTLDMGDPVNILQLAEELARLEGYEPGEDVEIEITGLRPGEKLTEQLHHREETAASTAHPRIRSVRDPRRDPKLHGLEEARAVVQKGNHDDARRLLADHFPTLHLDDDANGSAR